MKFVGWASILVGIALMLVAGEEAVNRDKRSFTQADLTQLIVLKTPSPGSSEGKIGYIEFHYYTNDFYVMSPDNSNRTLIVSSTNGSFTWSPDGNHLAFELLREGETLVFEGRYDIYMIDIDGSNLIRLTDNKLYNGSPAWSPDGNWIAFHSGNFDPNKPSEWFSDIYAVNVQEARQSSHVPEPRRLTRNGTSLQPAWSPDSEKLAFVSDCDLYVIDVSSLEPHNLSGTFDGCISEPVWSPSGAQIAFVVDHDYATSDVYVVDLDKPGFIKLTDEGGLSFDPRWKPDGTQIAFVTREGDFDIYASSPDGSGRVKLTGGEVHASTGGFSWSPDGRQIVFSSGPIEGNAEIFILDLENKSYLRLTENEFHDIHPVWLP